MILTSLHAENVLKYAHLTLHQVPEQGVFAVSGHNESGKSSIGETICFALFGRTFSLDPQHIRKIIRWGETRCSVAVTFRLGSEHLSLARLLDSDGNHSARLARVGEEDHPIARGADRVATALQERLGYDFDEFIESFYLAQREITTPHPHSEAVKIMAGLAPLERVSREFRNEIAIERGGIDEASAKIRDVDADIGDLGVDDALLPRLEQQRIADARAEGTLQDLADSLSKAKAKYAENRPAIAAAKGRQAVSGFLAFVLFLLAVAIGGTWAALTFAPDEPGTQWVRDHVLAQTLTDWGQRQGEYREWMMYGAVGLAVLFLVSGLRRELAKAKVKELRETCTQLGDTLQRVHATASPLDPFRDAPKASEPVRGEPVLGMSLGGQSPSVGDAPLPEVERPDDEEVRRMSRLIAADEAPEVQAEGLMARELAWLAHLINHRTAALADLDRELTIERGRHHRVLRLREMRGGFLTTIEDHAGRIAVREAAESLLRGAAQQISHRFNRDVRNLVGKTLPLFTDGRYEHLQIDADLNVRVFSADKRDFMGLDEISSGTQRQIMLALRLALSQQLLDRTGKDRQFVFLDEPFAFFDEARTRRALAELPGLSARIPQIFIVAQSFPYELAGGFTLHLQCAREKDVLEA
jgi:exonuclease SbcC